MVLILQVLRNKPDFRRKPWPSMSDSAKDFVKKLLVKDPHARLTAAQALSTYMLLDPLRSVVCRPSMTCAFYINKQTTGFSFINPLFYPFIPVSPSNVDIFHISPHIIQSSSN